MLQYLLDTVNLEITEMGDIMGVDFNKESGVFSLHTKNTTYQFMVDKYGYLIHLYYGKKIDFEMDYMITYSDHGFSGNPYVAGEDRTYSLDALPQEFPTLGTGDYRNTALAIVNHDGSMDCDLCYETHRILAGKYGLEGLPFAYSDKNATTLEIDLKDRRTGILVTLLFGALEESDVITRAVRVQNTGAQSATIERIYSACLDFLYGEKDVISFYGRHAMERNLQRKEIAHGTFTIGSSRGTSSHQYNPMLIIADKEATEKFGNVYALSFVYSGGFDAKVEKDQFDQIRILMGISEEQFSYVLEPGQVFVAPEVVMTYSANGIQSVSHNLHRLVRNNICRGKFKDSPRPIIVNSWEAAYFDFDGDKLYQLADQAVELGIEMLVLDDGWFGKRNDDNTSLGDWTVNEIKLGCSLHELVSTINKKGLKFGIWIEPEMISERSELFREHPEWVLQIPNKKPIRSRNQLVLDFANQNVVDYIFESISKVLVQANIEYVKWDMNRSLHDVFSNGTNYQGRVLHDYMLGVYQLLERLITEFPHILWEGCSGGGGRYDMGMLYYTPQIWCSDNTDAVNRTIIQYGTSFGYPLCTMGSHVSAVPNHQTGRVTDMNTRGVVSMTGAFGYELDLGMLTADERVEVKDQIVKYHEIEHLLNGGDYYRLSNPLKEQYSSWLVVNEEKSDVLLSLVMLEIAANMPQIYLKLEGLKSEYIYREAESGIKYSGAALMEAGFPVNLRAGSYQAYQWRFEKNN